MGISINADLLGLIGIAVSVILFVIGYRQTIGAKNERVTAANKEIERILIRRIVLEEYAPTRDDITRLLAGKAHDFRVKSDELATETQLFTAIFTRVFESDLIPSAQREEILRRLEPVIAEAERESLVEVEAPGERPADGRERSIWPLVWFALAASALGGVVVSLPQLGLLTTDLRAWLTPLLATFAGSLVTIGILIWFIRYRTGQEGFGREDPVEELTALEKQVSRALSSVGQVEERGHSRFGYDYLLTRGDTRTLVQARIWRRRLPQSFVDAIIGKVEAMAGELDADEAIIVTAAPVDLGDSRRKSHRVRFMTPSELRDHLRRPPAQLKRSA